MKNTLTFKPQAPDMDVQISGLSAKIDRLEQNQAELQEKIDRMATEVNEFFRALVSFVEMRNSLSAENPAGNDNNTDMTVVNDPLVKEYGRACYRSTAAKIIGVSPRTVKRMLEDGRLRTIGSRVDVISISEFLNNKD